LAERAGRPTAKTASDAGARIDADRLHREITIVDGLVFWSDGTADTLRQGNVAAVNLTVCGFQADFARCCDEMAIWADRLSRPDGPWHPVLAAADVAIARELGKVGLVMGWQNMRPIEDKLERLAFFHKLGVRVMQLTYNERNFIGDGCLEPQNGGLTALGRDAVREMNRLGIAVDVSHVGDRTTLDAIDISSKPVLVTHANARAIHPAVRNRSDEVLKAVAAAGGTIGVVIHASMCWDGDPRRRPDLTDVVRQLDYLVKLVGIEHVALGSDFPAANDLSPLKAVVSATLTRYPGFIGEFAKAFGNDMATRYPVDCGSPAALSALTHALVAQGWSAADIEAFYGGNLLRVLADIWSG